MKSSAYIADDENVLLVRFKHPHLDNWETDGPSVLPMGPAPVVVRMFPMVAGPQGLSAPHFGTSYQGYSSARMTSDSSVEKCGGANEVSCDWVRLHIFVAGKVNDKARVKLAKGAHPLFRCALSDRCVPSMEEHHDDKSTSRATPSRRLRLLL